MGGNSVIVLITLIGVGIMLLVNYFIIRAGAQRKIGSTIPFVIWLFFSALPPVLGLYWEGFVFAPVISLIAVLASSKREESGTEYYAALANLNNLHTSGLIQTSEFESEKIKLQDQRWANAEPNTLGVTLYVIVVALMFVLLAIIGLTLYNDRPSASTSSKADSPLSSFWNIFVSSDSMNTTNVSKVKATVITTPLTTNSGSEELHPTPSYHPDEDTPTEFISKPDNDTTLHYMPDEYARSINGDEALDKLIKSEVKYPSELLKNNEAETVYVDAIVEKDGTLSQITSASEVNKYLVQEAVRTLQNVSKGKKLYKPAIVSNKPVRSTVSIPVKFTTNE